MLLLWKYFTEFKPNSALQLHWSQCLSVHLLVAFLFVGLFFFFLEELTSCYVHFIFKGNISQGLLVPILSSQRSSCKYQCSSVDFRTSLLTPAKGGQAKQNIIFCVLFSFLYFAPPEHSFGDIWHFARKSSCKESLPSDVCKIIEFLSAAHFGLTQHKPMEAQVMYNPAG